MNQGGDGQRPFPRGAQGAMTQCAAPPCTANHANAAMHIPNITA